MRGEQPPEAAGSPFAFEHMENPEPESMVERHLVPLVKGKCDFHWMADRQDELSLRKMLLDHWIPQRNEPAQARILDERAAVSEFINQELK